MINFFWTSYTVCKPSDKIFKIKQIYCKPVRMLFDNQVKF